MKEDVETSASHPRIRLWTRGFARVCEAFSATTIKGKVVVAVWKSIDSRPEHILRIPYRYGVIKEAVQCAQRELSDVAMADSPFSWS